MFEKRRQSLCLPPVSVGAPRPIKRPPAGRRALANRSVRAGLRVTRPSQAVLTMPHRRRDPRGGRRSQRQCLDLPVHRVEQPLSLRRSSDPGLAPDRECRIGTRPMPCRCRAGARRRWPLSHSRIRRRGMRPRPPLPGDDGPAAPTLSRGDLGASGRICPARFQSPRLAIDLARCPLRIVVADPTAQSQTRIDWRPGRAPPCRVSSRPTAAAGVR